MQYHRNAKTNVHQREQIKNSSESSRGLGLKYGISHTSAQKWKEADHVEDASHRPHTIHYAVPKEFWTVIKQVRKKCMSTLDELVDVLSVYSQDINRSNCYRILKYYGLNKLSTEEKRKIKEFATYPPGYVHIDFFHMPKINGEKWYVFLAVDRATRMVFLEMYPEKSSSVAADFLLKALSFFPFKIHHILTDNGREFTMKDQYSFGRKNTAPTLFEIICEMAGIEHRKTKAYHPWTNGMAERMVRTVRDHTTHIERYVTAAEAAAAIKRFESYHNQWRRLGALGRKTPIQTAEEWFQKEPQLFIKNPSGLETIM